MTCNCKSYNQPELSQGDAVEVVVLDVPTWAGSERKSICVDACIAPVIRALWAARIWTLGCCCGHSGRTDRSVIVERYDRTKAAAVIRIFGDTAKVLAWELVEGDTYADAEPPTNDVVCEHGTRALQRQPLPTHGDLPRPATKPSVGQ